MFDAIEKISYDDVLDLISKPLTDDDMRRHGVDVEKDILKYGELDKYETIEELLPEDRSFKIILSEQDRNKGHWICIMRYKGGMGDVIEYFNSYGSKPSYELDFVSKLKNKFLNQNEKHLNKMLNKALKSGKYEIIYNKKRFQRYNPKIQTCGRHVIFRLLNMKHFGVDLKGYIELMEKLKEEFEPVFKKRNLAPLLHNEFIIAFHVR